MSEALHRGPAAEVEKTAATTYASGEVIQLEDGRAAVVDGLQAVASGDKFLLVAHGVKDLASASATTFALGADVFWDVSANVAITVPAAGDFYVGKCVQAKVNGDLVVLTDLNAPRTRKTVEAHTADDTLTALESGTCHTTTGAGGAVVLTLPAAVVGLEFFFMVGAAQELRLDPNGTETIALPSTGVAGAAGKYLTANAAGESVHIMCCVAGSWAVMGYTGTWTAEA